MNWQWVVLGLGLAFFATVCWALYILRNVPISPEDSVQSTWGRRVGDRSQASTEIMTPKKS